MTGITSTAFQTAVARASIVGALLFWAILLLAGAITPGYSHALDQVSELGAIDSPYPWLMNWLGIMPLAFAALACGMLLVAVFRPGPLAWLSGLFLILSGLGFVLAGAAQCDVDCRPSELASAQLHIVGSGAGFSAMLLSPLLLGLRAFHGGPERRFYLFALAVAAGYWIALFFLSGVVEHLRIVGPGFWQRVAIFMISIWIVGISFKIIAIRGHRTDQEPT